MWNPGDRVRVIRPPKEFYEGKRITGMDPEIEGCPGTIDPNGTVISAAGELLYVVSLDNGQKAEFYESELEPEDAVINRGFPDGETLQRVREGLLVKEEHLPEWAFDHREIEYRKIQAQTTESFDEAFSIEDAPIKKSVFKDLAAVEAWQEYLLTGRRDQDNNEGLFGPFFNR